MLRAKLSVFFSIDSLIEVLLIRRNMTMLHQLIWNFGCNFTNMFISDDSNSVAYNFLSNVKSDLMISQTLQTIDT